MKSGKSGQAETFARLRSNNPGTWYFAEYELGSLAKPDEKISFADFRGIIFCHDLVLKNGQRRFISYWRARDDYLANRADLASSIGTTTPKAVVEGYVVKESNFLSQEKSTPWWQSFKSSFNIIAVVTTTAAFLTALFTIADTFWPRLFEAPDLSFALFEEQIVDLASTQPLELRIPVVNYGNRTVDVVESENARLVDLAASDNQVPLSVERLPKIAKGQTEEVRLQSPPLAVGAYSLQLILEAKAGVFRGSRLISLEKELTVRVWDIEPTLDLDLVETFTNSAMMRATILLGQDAPQGVECEILVLGVPGVSFGHALLSTIESVPLSNNSPGNEVAKLTIRTLPMQKFTRTPFRIPLTGARSDGWQRVEDTAQAHCRIPFR